MTWVVATLLLSLTAEDPRIPIAELVLTQRNAAALRACEAFVAEDPQRGGELGLDYLRGHLLDRMGRHREAVDAYARAMTASPGLKPHALYRLAMDQEKLGHPEVAAGLVATLLSSAPPRSLVAEATQVLSRTLAMGGDCRLLGGQISSGLPRSQRRVLDLARADCALRDGKVDVAERYLLLLLEQDQNDTTARQAAMRLATLSPAPSNPQTLFLLGTTFHRHREFDRSSRYLKQVVLSASPPLPGTEAPALQVLSSPQFDTHYQLVRSLFWQGRYALAADGFGELAQRARRSREKAKALYNQARSYELLGLWEEASRSYRLSYQADPAGNYSGAALLSAMRVEWRGGKEESAQELLKLLLNNRRWRSEALRGTLFAATSELLRNRLDHVASWLLQAKRLGSRRDTSEVSYWKGRLAERQSNFDEALDQYLEAIHAAAFDPFAQAAQKRLMNSWMADVVKRRAAALANSAKLADLYSRWILLGDEDPAGQEARRELEKRLAVEESVAPFLDLRAVPVRDWPLWQQSLTHPTEMLLALGIWEEGSGAVRRHFPLSDPSLAFTGSRYLGAAGQVQSSLLIAEILSERIPAELPQPLVAVEYRRTLYPFSYASLLLQAAHRYRIDPYLLAAIIREESRFNAQAVSRASARGLTQFVFPTARRLAKKIGHGPLSPQDLDDPRVAIELGAAYLAELGDRFSRHQVVAAYNAGEPQAGLWQAYCYSREPEEFLSKVSFRETRNYLTKVLRSRAQYQDLYGKHIKTPWLSGPSP